ncbi:hypothetical protein Vretimale_18464 [Volvox reticuliferus]|uniref:Uncharacterized protein n=1 Tax=Volvox reticuliferus TaxID=1737510 RepID=A0A8J4GXY5_9CHLO|nr:hypothetical protein Vretifemale_19799 [Volvox reticuliferus]GIM15727.1 hypothetical protein Vretimale_18464 [Volvox reticuliferus]
MASADTSDNYNSGDNGPNSFQDDVVTVHFSFYFNIAKCAAWWSLWLFACAYAVLRRKVVSRAWFVYTALLFVICCNGIQSSAYAGYASHALKGHSGLVGYLIYLFFFNVSRSTFLAVLLVIASGYCITRSDLGPHKQHVVFVPTAVLVTGLITDFSFFVLASGPNADTYDISEMNTLVASVWFVCAVLNLAALILAWLYLFEALSKEVVGLEEDYKRRTGQLSDDLQPGAANPFTDAYAPLGRGPGKVPSPAQPRAMAQNPEAADADGQTVADHLAYTAKKKLLARFSLGVSSYLAAEICIVLLPLFVISVLQSTVQVLQFVVYFIFMAVLIVIFRPQEQSSYLMIGFSEEDAEERGVNHLLTGIAIDMASTTYKGDAAANSTTIAGASSTAGGGPSSSTPSRSSRKADIDAERYRQIPSAPSSSTAVPVGNQFAPLPVSTLGSGSASGPPGAVPQSTRSAKRGPQPRTRQPPTQPAPDAGQFTLCSDDEGADDDASHPLTRGMGKGY